MSAFPEFRKPYFRDPYGNVEFDENGMPVEDIEAMNRRIGPDPLGLVPGNIAKPTWDILYVIAHRLIYHEMN